jgi:hypothetical protein
MRFFRVPLCVMILLSAAACGASATTPPPQDTSAAPTATAEPTVSIPTETPAPTGPLGTISGRIVPPNSDSPLPAAHIYAHEVSTGRVFFADVAAGQTDYVIRDIPVGVYEVVGWFFPDGTAGAYTSSKISSAETSSNQLKCNTSLLKVILKEGRMDAAGIDINCWGGDYYYLITPMP